MRQLLRLLRPGSRYCDVHDRPSPMTTAQLERDTGIDPLAVAKLQADETLDFINRYANPQLIDCGRRWCYDRRHP